MDIRYSYAHVPTIREFAASNARVRGIRGPFVVGKVRGASSRSSAARSLRSLALMAYGARAGL